MTFKQLLKLAREHNIPARKLLVVNEVDTYLDINEIKVSEEEFEAICEFVYEWVLSTTATPTEVVDALCRIVQNDDYIKYSNLLHYWDELTTRINNMF